MLVFWLLTMLAYNLFFTFYRRNLKSAVRDAYDTLQIGRVVIAELYHSLANRPRPSCICARSAEPPAAPILRPLGPESPTANLLHR